MTVNRLKVLVHQENSKVAYIGRFSLENMHEKDESQLKSEDLFIRERKVSMTVKGDSTYLLL